MINDNIFILGWSNPLNCFNHQNAVIEIPHIFCKIKTVPCVIDHSAEFLHLHNVLHQQLLSLFNEQFLWYFRESGVCIVSLKENHSLLI